MKSHHSTFNRFFAVFSLIVFTIAVPFAAPQEARAEEPPIEGVQLVEEGIVANPEALKQGTQINGDSDTDDEVAWEGYITANLKLVPTWQNPRYVKSSAFRGVSKSACTSNNYRVISSARPGSLGNSAYYTCWTGSGQYNSGSAMGRYGNYGVSMVCPGNNRGQIEHKHINDAGNKNYVWSPVRGPHPNNTAGGRYCYNFTSLRVYRSVKLNR